jgi:hypothetical protein
MQWISTVWLLVLTLPALCQETAIPSNSFEKVLHQSFTYLHYHYDSLSQTHDYTGNWDFDQDGISDEIRFIGTGGAHVYYYLQVVLSSNKKTQSFPFIQSDFPMLTATDTSLFDRTPAGFVVAAYGPNRAPAIIVRLDSSTFDVFKETLRKRKIRTQNIVVRFEKGKVLLDSL